MKPFIPILLHDTCVRHAMLLSLEHVRLNTDVAKDCFATWVRSGIFFLAKNWEDIYEWVQNLETDGTIVKEVKIPSKNPVP